MPTTRKTLLLRVKDPSDHEAWSEFHAIYSPLLYRYARQRRLSHVDAEEIRDQCLAAISRQMPNFEYDKEKGGFQKWLRRVVDNKVIDLIRKRRERQAGSDALRAIPDTELPPDKIWEQTWRDEHIRYCVEKARSKVSERNYQVFHMLLLGNHTVNDVCSLLALNANQVYKAKARVLKVVASLLKDLGSGVEP